MTLGECQGRVRGKRTGSRHGQIRVSSGIARIPAQVIHEYRDKNGGRFDASTARRLELGELRGWGGWVRDRNGGRDWVSD